MTDMYVYSDLMLKIAPAVTFLTVLVALWQISVAKKALVTSSKREAVTLAADKCNEAADKLIPLHTQLCNRSIFLWELSADPKVCAINIANHEEAMKWLETLRQDKEMFAGLINFSNKVESFAMYFANGAADERIAYPAMGETFCHWVTGIAPVIVWMRKNNNCNSYYTNTINLYKIWSQRRAKDKLCEEISQLTAKKQEIKDSSIKVIGV